MLFTVEKSVSVESYLKLGSLGASRLQSLRNLKTVAAPAEVLSYLSEIKTLADSERKGLGFFSEGALKDAIEREKIIVLVDQTTAAEIFVGYVLHSGIYPNAKIQQIATVAEYRKRGVGSALIRALVSYLERLGFWTLRADVAGDLLPALAFYKKNGFLPIKDKRGGSSRNRNIIIHSRELNSETLFSLADADEVDLGIRRRSAGDTPFYAFDLNVYFDLAKERKHTVEARKLFAAAMAQDIRLTVASEFVQELRRTTQDAQNDPVLQLALQLPRLPKVQPGDLLDMKNQIHDVVFVQSGSKAAYTDQAFSDAGHLAHAALSRASAFITRDSELLRARGELILRFGIDVVSIDDLLKMLPPDTENLATLTSYGSGFITESANKDDVASYLQAQDLRSNLMSEFAGDVGQQTDCWRRVIRVGGDTAGVAVLLSDRITDRVCRLLIHCRQETLDVELYTDYLMDQALREASKTSVSAVELECAAGQATLVNLAKTKGFTRQGSQSSLTKVVMGRPVTKKMWPNAVEELRRRTGLILPNSLPEKRGTIEVVTSEGRKFSVSRSGLEGLLGPTVLGWPDRGGVLIPIRRGYSEQLLGASPQLSLLENKDAVFLSRRSYVGDPKSAAVMKPDAPLLFYESMPDGGAGAVVAVARIVDAVIFPKIDVTDESAKRLVVESVDGFSKTEDVLVTSFDSVFVIPHPISFSSLKKMKAIDGSNLVTARPISGKQVNMILDMGWNDELER